MCESMSMSICFYQYVCVCEEESKLCGSGSIRVCECWNVGVGVWDSWLVCERVSE